MLFGIACICVLVFLFYIYASGCEFRLPSADSGLSLFPSTRHAQQADSPVDAPSEARDASHLKSRTSSSRSRPKKARLKAVELDDLPARVSNYTLTRVPYFTHPYEPSSARGSFDSLAESVLIQGRYDTVDGERDFVYHLCVLRNVCVSEGGYYFHFSNRTQWEHYDRMLAACNTYNRPVHLPHESICSCFHEHNRAMLVPFAFVDQQEAQKNEKNVAQQKPSPSPFRYMNGDTATASGASDTDARDHRHAFVMHKWVTPHHIAHWAMKLLLMQSIFHHWRIIAPLRWLTSDAAVAGLTNEERMIFPPLPKSSASYVPTDGVDADLARPFNTLVFQDSDASLTDHELAILRLSMLQAWGPRNRLVRDLFTEEGEIQTRYHLSASPEEAQAKAQQVFRQPHLASHVYFMHELASGRYRTDMTVADASKKSGEEVVVPPKDGSTPPPPAPASPPWSTCFPRVTFSPTYSRFAETSQDLSAWREAAYEYFELGSGATDDDLRRPPVAPNLVPAHVGFRLAQLTSKPDDPLPPPPAAPSHLVGRRCPPRRAILLVRGNRGVLNRDDLVDWLRSEYRLQVEITTIDGASSALEQATLFSTSGLILSSHSSQLTNVVFAHPGSCVVELTPFFWNDDFAAYAHAAGVRFQYAIGGTVPHTPDQIPTANDTAAIRDVAAHDACSRLLESCLGDSHCIRARSAECDITRRGHDKRRDFFADMPRARHAIRTCINHLNWQCYGAWPR